ncbi:MAG TPA: hypothetical protein VFB84_02840 [Micromonosporaceae bacterium]|nr:hypothetical protein [Micromonosporaceae bacterium]
MRRTSYRIGAAILVAGAVLVGAAPAYAAAPANDTFGGAVAIGSVPYTATLDTTEATTDADDVNANADCGAPATDASVWYSTTPATSLTLVVDVSSSSYTAGVLVVTGAPGAFQIVACGPDAVAFAAAAGTTYHLLLIDDQLDGGGNGGTLVVNVAEAPPAPTVQATVDRIAGFDPRTGAATLHGTVSCTGIVEFAFVDVEVRQRVGRGEVFGFGTVPMTCDGITHPWSVEISPVIGSKFAGGKAVSVTFAVACGPFECGLDFQQHIVQLSRRG